MRTRPRFLWALTALALLWGLADAPAGLAATASGARLGIHSEGVTRFVLDLSDQVGFKVTPLADPYRIAIELSGTDYAGPGGISKPWGAVNAMRLDGGRIVLDLRKPALVKNAFIIPPRDGLGHRLVVDLSETTHAAFMAAAGNAKAPVLKAPAAAKAAPPPPPAPKPVEEFHLPEAVAPTAPAANASRIVVTSPNAPAESLPPEPVTAAPPQPVAVAQAPVNLIPPPMPVERPQMADPKVVDKAGRPMLSAPMPPPPERPAPPQPVAAPQPASPPPQVLQAVQPAPQPSSPPTESVAKAKDGVPVIVIDPGHGGVDPGATGVSGTYEKHITLAMARELKTMLERNGRYRVHLTRDRDVFIRLRERIAIARAQGADLFISLHADAVQNPQIRGLSVYTLSRNASDSEAQALAEKENKADLIAGIDLTHESADVANILIDLAQRETMNRSAGFATELVDEVGQEMDLLGNTHRFAGFAVLKAPDVPAVLVEMGYLSNEAEERMLRQPQYRARLAKSVAKAVERFFPPNLKAKRP
ncbi:Putative N-acetylmuramoyl-L-alanine amidase [Magnetospirillum sp. XM-1]|uniref:N-acetylmuramoyl-L-alanine amidase n=1 Tax=Magnetospirillum sp. XM-1 TaxID=1663591 RepID=UPI00073DFCB0|nr:N-acetylmuramoyl-L-alanine amidase [Magnetospirillum sp. XM-1]CUW41208.1 Putative N-acetylmuramoyl-L-alanine amidase [Magnetospirillum sp. XM-1]